MRILGIGDGPASFNAEATRLGVKVTSIDPIYQFSATEIMKRFYEVVDNIIDQIKATPASWYGHTINLLKIYETIEFERSMNSLTIMTRESKKETIVEHYQALTSKERVRYSLMLTLFCFVLWALWLSVSLQFIREMLRVSKEVFSHYWLLCNVLNILTESCRNLATSDTVSTLKVQYELQKGGNEMLVIKIRDLRSEWNVSEQVTSELYQAVPIQQPAW